MRWIKLDRQRTKLIGLDEEGGRLVCCYGDDLAHLHSELSPQQMRSLIDNPLSSIISHRGLPKPRNVVCYPTLLLALTRARDDGCFKVLNAPAGNRGALLAQLLGEARTGHRVLDVDAACGNDASHAWLLLPRAARSTGFELWHINQDNWSVLPPKPRICT